MLKDTERQMKFFSLRLQGKTLLEITAELEISLSTANRWNKFFKADIINARNADMERLRRKIAEKYEKYFDFLDQSFDRLYAETLLHKEIAMTYDNLLKYSTKVLDSIYKIDIFRKFADKSARGSAPEDTIPETDYSQSYVPKHVIEKLEKC